MGGVRIRVKMQELRPILRAVAYCSGDFTQCTVLRRNAAESANWQF